MRLLLRAALPMTLAVLAGCGRKGERSSDLSEKLCGSYVRQDPLVPEGRTHLNLTPSGIAVTSPSMGMSESIEVAGRPIMKGSIKLGTAGSALFASVRCDDARACGFTTKDGCEGTITGDGKGAVVIVATGECTPWSGKWLPEKEDDAGAATPGCPPPPACPPSPADPPTAPTGSGTASDPFGPGHPSSLDCLKKCNEGTHGCMHECKVGDMACMRRCSDRTMECVERCH
jgi:hypothetical protein